MDKLLKEAIADAKSVRETALANAKIALEEAFTPHLKSMLSKKLQAEMEGEDEEKADEGYHGEEEEEMDEELEPSDIGASDNKEPAPEAGDTSGIGQGPESEGDDEEGGEEDENLEKAPDQPVGEGYGMDDDEDMEEGEHMDDEDMEDEGAHMDDEGMHDEDDDIEEVLRQLEAEMEDEDEDMKEEMEDEDEDKKEEGAHMDDEDEDKKEEGAHMDDEEKEMDEEIDLDEIIKALTEEEGMEDEDEEKNEEMEDEDEDMKEELEEYKKTVQYLRDKLSEVNLLNAKLLYTNKLFRSRNVSEAQKMKVIEQFDRAANVREVKLVYTTFAESMKRKPVNESAKRVSQASKPTASTQTKKKPIIGENTDFKSRMKKLANII